MAQDSIRRIIMINDHLAKNDRIYLISMISYKDNNKTVLVLMRNYVRA